MSRMLPSTVSGFICNSRSREERRNIFADATRSRARTSRFQPDEKRRRGPIDRRTASFRSRFVSRRVIVLFVIRFRGKRGYTRTTVPINYHNARGECARLVAQKLQGRSNFKSLFPVIDYDASIMLVISTAVAICCRSAVLSRSRF